MFKNLIGIFIGSGIVSYTKKPKFIYEMLFKKYIRIWRKIKLQVLIEEDRPVIVYLKCVKNTCLKFYKTLIYYHKYLKSKIYCLLNNPFSTNILYFKILYKVFL